ncbi:MAG: RdgB/HAM1 family non-canonical purine NTP pyrophosphatase [Chitinophagaceae bacterium]|nr:RdgB/HAM1 family non-canonical purine NTP pyrophosphatase [Chitinophagaceae bacterium]
MRTLIFATNNDHKAEEIRALLKNQVSIITLKEAGIEKDIPEPFDTLEENARAKSTAIYEWKAMDCFGEDTGLEVYALDMEPGVKSARYAGDDRSPEANIDKLLRKMEGLKDRRARFRTVISLLIDGKENLFEGICEGRITEGKKGSQGFGYDPVFIPEGAGKSFAEMTMEEKGRYSHRGIAVQKLVAFLSSLV